MEQRFIALQTAVNEKIAVTSSSRKRSKNGLIVSKSMGFPSLPVVGWLLGHFAHTGAQNVGWLLALFSPRGLDEPSGSSALSAERAAGARMSKRAASTAT